MSFTKLPSHLMIEILSFLDDDMLSISNLSITTSTINTYFKSEPPVLHYVIKQLIRELNIYKSICKSYRTIKIPYIQG